MMKVSGTIYGNDIRKIRWVFTKTDDEDHHFDDFIDCCTLIDITNKAIVEQSTNYFIVEYPFDDNNTHKWIISLFNRTQRRGV